MPPATAPARKFCLPATKSLSETVSVEATKPCTSMRAEGPKTTPFGFTSQTRPLGATPPTPAGGPACWEKTALPPTTCGPAGNAHAADAARAAAAATATARRRWHSLEFERAPFFIVSHPETAQIYYML